MSDPRTRAMIGAAIVGFLAGAALAIVELVRTPDAPAASPPALEDGASPPTSTAEPAPARR